MASEAMKAFRRSSMFMVPEHHEEGAASGSTVTFGHEPEHKPKQPPKVQYENTYQLEPSVTFRPDEVGAIIKHTLHKYLEDFTYEPRRCATLSKVISAEIKNKVKAMGFKRYRIVCVVTIGEKRQQGVWVGSRCVWDDSRDSFSSASFHNQSLFAVGEVYAVYFE